MKHCWMPGVDPFFNVRERLELFVPLYLLVTNISATLSGSQVPLLNDRAIQPFSLPSLHIKKNRKKSKNLSIEQLSFSILGQEPCTLCALVVAIFHSRFIFGVPAQPARRRAKSDNTKKVFGLP